MDRPVETVALQLGNVAAVIRADRSLLLPEASALVASDLHLGKPYSFAARGFSVPGGVDAKTLRELDRALAETGARRMLVLGDVLHEPAATPERVRRELLTSLAALSAEVVVVPGNHDRLSLRELTRAGLSILTPGESWHGIALLHEPPRATAGRPWLAGHLHPACRVSAPGERLRVPCFVCLPSGVILPAFGAFTGGMLVTAQAGVRRVALIDGALIPIDGPVERD